MEGDYKNIENRGYQNSNAVLIFRIIPRSVELIFNQIDYLKNFGWEFKTYVSFQEVALLIVKLILRYIMNKQEIY